MLRIRITRNTFIALYGAVSAGTIVEMTPADAELCVAAGRGEYVD